MNYKTTASLDTIHKHFYSPPKYRISLIHFHKYTHFWKHITILATKLNYITNKLKPKVLHHSQYYLGRVLVKFIPTITGLKTNNFYWNSP